MTDPLDELVSEGRSKRREADDAEKRAAREETREVDRSTRSRLWASTSSFALWHWWAWAVVASAVTGIALHRVIADEDTAAFASICGAVPFLVIAWQLRGTFGRAAVARNEAKLRALPFRVSGYAAALSNNRTEGKAQLVVRFADGKSEQRDDVGFREAGMVVASAADEKTLADAFYSIGATLEKEPRKDGARVVDWEIESGESSFSTNAHLDRFIWCAVKVLEAIHARHPIASVEIHGFR